MTHPRILIQLDSDSHPSVFDSVVAIDAGTEHLLQYGSVNSSNVVPLIHGAMFTRGPQALCNTAVFVGGSNLSEGEAIGSTIRKTFFGPIRVSVMLDGNGANTTAAAAVLCAARHVSLADQRAVVLGGSGPVGSRVARLLLRQGTSVCLASRTQAKAESTCRQLKERMELDVDSRLQPLDTSNSSQVAEQLAAATLIISCGAAGVTMLDQQRFAAAKNVRVAIDLNAVPPVGLPGIESTDEAVARGSRNDYGALGVGGLKMRIHRAGIKTLFSDRDQFLDTDEIFDIGQQLEDERNDK